MQDLKELFDSILNQTEFGPSSKAPAEPLPHKSISQAESRDFSKRDQSDEDMRQVQRSRPTVPDESLSQLTAHLRPLLNDYIDVETDCIGHSFPVEGIKSRITMQSNSLRSYESQSSMEEFAKGLIRGAAVMGAERVLDLLSGWIQGKPVEYRTSALLNGPPIKASLAPLDGVHIEHLPFSTDKLPANLPRLNQFQAEDYLGRTIVSIDSTASPALFRPQSDYSNPNVHVEPIAGVNVDTVCQALSLESDSYMGAAFYWNDYQELTAFSSARGKSTWSLGNAHFKKGRPIPNLLDRNLITGVTALVLGDDQLVSGLSKIQLARTLEALKTLGNSDKTRIAVSRWVKSKDSGEHLEDRFIDLRIALECLYVQDFRDAAHTQAYRFKLPLFGAWHLGTDFEERKCIRKKLRQVYDAASKAVHSGDLEYFENQQLLSTAQDLCRRGILKLLKEGVPSDWGDLILGIENE